MWQQVVGAVMDHGPVQLVATKSRVCLLARTRFLWCPQAHKAGTIFVRFCLPYRIDSPRLRSDNQGDRWSHRVRLSEVDDEAMAWFRQAYDFDTA